MPADVRLAKALLAATIAFLKRLRPLACNGTGHQSATKPPGREAWALLICPGGMHLRIQSWFERAVEELRGGEPAVEPVLHCLPGIGPFTSELPSAPISSRVNGALPGSQHCTGSTSYVLQSPFNLRASLSAHVVASSRGQ